VPELFFSFSIVISFAILGSFSYISTAHEEYNPLQLIRRTFQTGAVATMNLFVKIHLTVLPFKG